MRILHDESRMHVRGLPGGGDALGDHVHGLELRTAALAHDGGVPGLLVLLGHGIRRKQVHQRFNFGQCHPLYEGI